MRNTLPHLFKEQMSGMLDPRELEPFLASYDDPRTYGLRLNPAKITGASEQFRELQEHFALEPVPWCPTGWYYREDARPGKHPFHAAGLYYLQEPSAMSAAELLNPQPGETVLDLAAAPGGKSTQIAAKLGPSGLLVANEIHPARALILSENVERMGCANTIVVNAAPDKLAERFPQFFDKIMLDAPCSGEGMFRKDPEAMGEWSPGHVDMCAARQLDIMQSVVVMLKAGGILGYSTCTFNRQENEELIGAVLGEFPCLELVRTERIWPHKERGEGHFVAVLRRHGGGAEAAEAAGTAPVAAGAGPLPGASGERPRAELRRSKHGAKGGAKGAAGSGKPLPRQTVEAWELFLQFAADMFIDTLPLPAGEPLLFGEQLYWLPHGEADVFRSAMLEGIRVPRPGLHLATVKKNRVEPAHALALAVPLEAFERHVSLPADSPQLAAYLRGETAASPGDTANGWLPVCVNCYPIGWAKCSEGQLKNHYPKGLRRP
ncbi:MAG: Fmu (Sun) domain protein [Paenibacillaceae bacterium]|jgi:16S rRNA C967 or C1407 C5-methylase (RsmB/RsmF family)/NOL1/NOP2/fmu family ribosome biogenesis protein|nr:Fmu (Sun) domain protein [Paenibacillaceae bacterium]